jgi:hypothetical protein
VLRGVLSVRLGDGPRGVFEPAPPLFTRVDIAGPVPQGLLVRGNAQRRTGVDAQSDQSVRKVFEMMMSNQKVNQLHVCRGPPALTTLRLKGRLRSSAALSVNKSCMIVRNVSPDGRSRTNSRRTGRVGAARS